MKLYHYVHCPFCIRVRMALGFLKIPYESIVLPYDDEKTPVELTGKKMLPILQIKERALNESLDIIQLLDQNNLLQTKELITAPRFAEIESYLSVLGNDVHSLAMPYWIYTPEFNANSRAYFQKKKEEKRGPFKELVKNKLIFQSSLQKNLNQFEQELTGDFILEQFSVLDLMIASHLWGLYVVPEFQFSVKLNNYLQNIARITSFNYHEDLWR